jgi:hypothetical protein
MSGHKYIQRGRGVVYTCVFMIGKHKIGLNLRLKNTFFLLKQHIFLCLCVFRNAPFCSRTSFHSRCVSYEICRFPRRNYTPKHDYCLAILISICNFHISLQFSYHLAILMFRCIVPSWAFAIFIWVCNFHDFASFISVCNSHVMTPALTYVTLHGFYVTMTLN